MVRLLLQALVRWKEQAHRKPVLIDGARQVGKTYLVENLFSKYFGKVLKLNFLAEESHKDIFLNSLDPKKLISQIELTLDLSFDPAKDLLFFDEIGECQRAVDSLKFFAEQRPDIFVCASGSNIGLLNSFPVGKVHNLELFPLCFEEFLMAKGQKSLINAYREMDFGTVAHAKLYEQLTDFYYVGGMPEAVEVWFEDNGESTLLKTRKVKTIHKNLINGYKRDFGKYASKREAGIIQAVFDNIPEQLSRHVDSSVKRFQFKGVSPKRSRYRDFESAIDWLVKCKLTSQCYPVDCKPRSPLKSLRRENIFKLFFIDVGLLCHVLDISYQELKKEQLAYKGFIAENFVQNEFITLGYEPTFSWMAGSDATAEIEFLYKDSDGNIIPIEVKSGKRVRSFSLKSYVERFNPEQTLKLVGTQCKGSRSNSMFWPLYYAGKIMKLTTPEK